MVFSDFLNLFLFNTNWNAGTLIRALQADGLLPEPGRAEPDRLQRQEASFLAGGEFPVPVVERQSGRSRFSSRSSASG